MPGRQVPKMGMETLAVITVGPSNPSTLLQPAPFPLSRASLPGSLCCSAVFSSSLVPWGRIQTLPLCLQALHSLALPTFLSLLLEPSFTLNGGHLPSESLEPCHPSILYELAEVSPFSGVWGSFWTCTPPTSLLAALPFGGKALVRGDSRQVGRMHGPSRLGFEGKPSALQGLPSFPGRY